MKKWQKSFVWSVMLTGFSFISWKTCQADIVSDFEDLALPANSHVAGAPGPGAEGTSGETPFTSRGVTYRQTWQQFGSFTVSSGFSYSNRTDIETRGFTNQFSAYSTDGSSEEIGLGGQGGSSNYAVAHNPNRGSSKITLEHASMVSGMYLTNTTYAYHAIVSGDDGNETPFVKGPFSEGDYFKLEIFGVNQAGQDVGQVDFYLADYRDSAQIAISNWTWVDLSSLGSDVKHLEFQLSSTDNHSNPAFGMNTPAYFAMDNLSIAAVPEPMSSGVLFGLLLTVPALRRRRSA